QQSEQRRRRRLAMRGLEIEQEALALKAAGVAGEPAALADDAVAGDDHREGIVANGTPHRASQGDVAELAGEVAVGGRLAVGNLLDETPDLALEAVPDPCYGESERGTS